MLKVEQIARICHEANRHYSESAGLEGHLPWSHAPEWQKKSAIMGVEAIIANPWMGPADTHRAWLAHKQAEGWVYGVVKNETTKEHPCMVPYLDLPEAQRVKDLLFVNIVRALIEPPYKDFFDPSAPVPVALPNGLNMQAQAQGYAASYQQNTQQEVSSGQVNQTNVQSSGEAAQEDRDGDKDARGEAGGKTET